VRHGRPYKVLVTLGYNETVDIVSIRSREKPLLFDAYIFIDWSSANSRHPEIPTGNAPWIGELIAGDSDVVETYHRTRQSACDHALDSLIRHVQLNHRVLVGFDFPYGYPHGFSQALGFQNSGDPWISIWEHLSSIIEDDVHNHNNRFEIASHLDNIISGGEIGPFWGHPQGRNYPNLLPHQPAFPFNAVNNVCLQKFRIVETRLPGVSSTWQLFGIGVVGSQALTGIPRLHSLANHANLAHCSQVWPFQTGFKKLSRSQRGPFILHAEIWPGIVAGRVQNITQANNNIIRDQAQVRAMCQWAYDLDKKNRLCECFDRPTYLNDQQVEHCTQEEGWILGTPLI